MDDTTSRAVLAFPAEYVDADGERFFDTLIECRPTTVDELVPAIAEHDGGLAALAERYRDNVRAAGIESAWPDVVAGMANEGSGARLVAAYHELTPTEIGWPEFVAQQRDFWATWNGTDWPAWRTAFAQTGAQYGLTTDTEAQLAWLDDLTTPERATYLRDTLGFTVHPAAFEEAAEETPTTWPEFVEQQRDFWATWNGTDWPAWRTAFAQTGAQYGLTTDTEAQLAWLDDLTTPERATYLRDTLGFTVHPAALEAAAPVSTDEAVAAIEALPPEQVEAVVSATIDSIMDEVANELPALAQELGMSVEELRAQLADLPADEIAGAIQAGLPG